jgi:hypothetical protein
MPGNGPRLAAETCYVAAIAALATLGGVQQQAAYYLTAVALSLPLGLPALLGIYGGYGLIATVGGAFTVTAAPNSDPAPWLTVSTAVLDVLLLTAAAVGNVLLLRRRTRRASVR